MASIKIKPISRRNHLFFSLLALIGFVVALWLQQNGVKLPSYILLLIALILGVFGLSKWLEPKYSFTFSDESITWHCRQGDITLAWKNIAAIHSQYVNKGQGKTELNYLGVTLWDLTPVIKSIPPRLAKSLYHEYRSLLHVALLEAQFRDDDTRHLQEDADFWIASNGEKITGLKGMFAARLKQLKQYLGSDIYFPLTALDRNSDDFISYFNRFRQQIENSKTQNDAITEQKSS